VRVARHLFERKILETKANSGRRRWRGTALDLGCACATCLRIKSLDRSAVPGGGDSPAGCVGKDPS
jgi:hypothetical protein